MNMKSTDLSRELRICNLVYYRDKSKVLTVENIGSKGFSTLDENGLEYGSDDVSEYNGIELTEEWLLKMGFEITESSLNNIKHIYNGFLSLNTYINWNGRHNFFWLRYYQQNSPKIKYIHQLQNLYHALTGEELTIK